MSFTYCLKIGGGGGFASRVIGKWMNFKEYIKYFLGASTDVKNEKSWNSAGKMAFSNTAIPSLAGCQCETWKDILKPLNTVIFSCKEFSPCYQCMRKKRIFYRFPDPRLKCVLGDVYLKVFCCFPMRAISSKRRSNGVQRRSHQWSAWMGQAWNLPYT